jgi:ABC-type tungstate transport system permease subunit
MLLAAANVDSFNATQARETFEKIKSRVLFVRRERLSGADTVERRETLWRTTSLVPIRSSSTVWS